MEVKYFPVKFVIIGERIDEEVMSLIEKRYPKRFPQLQDWEQLWEVVKMNITCTVCREEKHVSLFVKDKRREHGVRTMCKKCNNLKRRKTPLPPVPKEGHKYCCDCNVEKPLSEFNHYMQLGRKRPTSYCKPCEHTRDKNRYGHTCAICKKVYRSGKKNTTICHSCRVETVFKTENNPGIKPLKADKRGEKNPMYGVQRFGSANPNFKEDITEEEREKGRLITGYGLWRKGVYERDNYTCQCCGSNKGGTLVAHHLNGYHWFKEGRTDVNNGVTLCVNCHDKFHEIYGKFNNNEIQYITYLTNEEYLS